MLGGFNIVKHENHHYKYAHCVNINDIKRICFDYKTDLSPGKSWKYSLSSLNDAKDAFRDSGIIYFEGELPSLTTGSYMFYNNKTLVDWNIDLPNLVTGNYMFRYNKLTKWNINLSKLTNGSYMFADNQLSNWNIELPNLTNGAAMFESNKIVSWNIDLPKLTNGTAMFLYNQLSNWKANLPSLTSGNQMFQNNTNLINFEGDISKLSTGTNMFGNCILNKQSVSNIISSIPTHTSGSHPITIGIHADNCCDEEISSIIAEGTAKGWTVTTQWNGNPTKNEVINSEKIAKLELDTITLPEGYKRCEYLESDTNNQYIDTEIIPTNTTGTWIIAKRISDTVDGFHLAVRTDSNNYYPPMLRSNGNYHGWGAVTEWTNFTKQNTAFESYINYPINGTIVKEAIAIDNAGTTVTKELTTDLPTISQSLYMFGRNYSGTLDRTWNGRIYRVKISEGDQIIRDFIPALDPDGKPCMYEMIEGKPYYNAATIGDDFLYKVYEDYIMPEL